MCKHTLSMCMCVCVCVCELMNFKSGKKFEKTIKSESGDEKVFIVIINWHLWCCGLASWTGI